MNRFLTGGIAAMLMLAAGLFWWQGIAGVEPPPLAPAASVGPKPPPVLPVGDSQAKGAPPPGAGARPKFSTEQRRFRRYDANQDGIITRNEMMGSRTAAFRKLDKDGNNLLSFEEWAVRTADRFGEADQDHDGRLSPAEFATTASKPSAKPKCRC